MGKLLTEKQLCEELQIHRNTLRNWKMAGCPYTGAQGSYRYDIELVRTWMDNRDKEMGGTDTRIMIEEKHLWQYTPEGIALQETVDQFLAKIPEDLQDEFEDLTNNLVFEAFEAGYRTAARR